ncbi:ATP-binding protein [Streptomyces zingiberis]|uniref:ATP-binding protein n=1 Tax=Streptomyces zingiberis TaxID=2053010 RepID=A0ABX1BZP3_9ACTN|nr:ATP-binding protein [Streptomyces zingiberis]NJQ01873.1 ATP-binding protein [Streptomyces zingiberis]
MRPAPLPTPYGFRVAPDLGAPSRARRRILTVVRRWGVPLSERALRDIELMSSEVITNAIVHTGATCTVVLRWTGQRLRVEVTDTSPESPMVNRSDADEEHGRGMLLVEALASCWGSRPVAAGKEVWFEVATDRRATGQGRLSSLVRVGTLSARTTATPPPGGRRRRVLVLARDTEHLPLHLLRPR